MLGVGLDEDMKIEEVMPDSVASKAGLKAGDRLLKVDGKDVKEREDLQSALAGGEAKKTVVIERDGKQVELTVEWPAAPAGN